MTANTGTATAALQTLADWLACLEQRHPLSIDMGLARVGEVASRLQLNPAPCPVITVGGTNGKGSTVATLVSIYRATGLRVGCYTSPHLLHFNERIAINGEPVGDAELIAAFAQVEAARGEISLTYFEFTTLAALLLFRQAGLDVMVLEVGLGGRLDAVNVLDADIAVVTSIGIDHIEYLGDSREQIAAEKAGIFRAGKPVVCGDAEPPASLLAQARTLGCRLYCRGRDFDFHATAYDWDWQCAAEPGRRAAAHELPAVLRALPRPTLALDNVATALMVVRLAPLPVSESALRQGLTQARLAGRMQRLAQAPEIILDVAHNPHGAAFLMRQLPPARVGQRSFAVFAMLADKDMAGVVDACRGHIDAWHVASLPVPRGAAATQLLPLLRARGCAVAGVHDSVAAALQAARQQAAATDRILVFGSFYTVAAAQQALMDAGLISEHRS